MANGHQGQARPPAWKGPGFCPCDGDSLSRCTGPDAGTVGGMHEKGKVAFPSGPLLVLLGAPPFGLCPSERVRLRGRGSVRQRQRALPERRCGLLQVPLHVPADAESDTQREPNLRGPWYFPALLPTLLLVDGPVMKSTVQTMPCSCYQFAARNEAAAPLSRC